jgi:hypothetical protein
MVALKADPFLLRFALFSRYMFLTGNLFDTLLGISSPMAYMIFKIPLGGVLCLDGGLW